MPKWERIFANPMAAAAAIDRVMHHSVILEFDVPSYRTNAAQQEERHVVASMASSSSTAWSRLAMFQLTTVIMTFASAGPVAGLAYPGCP